MLDRFENIVSLAIGIFHVGGNAWMAVVGTVCRGDFWA